MCLQGLKRGCPMVAEGRRELRREEECVESLGTLRPAEAGLLGPQSPAWPGSGGGARLRERLLPPPGLPISCWPVLRWVRQPNASECD